MTIQGRGTNEEETRFVRKLIRDNPEPRRTALSKELAKIWNWRDSSGRLKDMACRTFMLKLHNRGKIVLPPPRRTAPKRKKSHPEVSHSKTPITGPLKKLLPLRIEVVSPRSEFLPLFKNFLAKYHYLGYGGTVGKNISYLIRDNSNRPLGCLLFGAAAWQIEPRDSFIGWSHETRRNGLDLIVNNTRFLILPWVKVTHLASCILGGVSRRIQKDWVQKYNHPVYLLEIFVEKERFKGTCYKASNWKYLGDTKGLNYECLEY